MFYSAVYPSPIGSLTLACDQSGNALVGLWIEGQKYFEGSLPEAPDPGEGQPVLCQAKLWLDRYFAGENPPVSEVRLAPIGSDFRQEVWALLRRIPYGQVTTYGDLGKEMALRRGLPHLSGQAVGGAVGHNPISILIPCHRVIGANGSLTGYAGGLEKKLWLLKHEGAAIAQSARLN